MTLPSTLVGLAWPGATALVTGYWVLVGLAGGAGAPVSTDGRGAAAAAATAALVGAGWRPGSVRGAQLAALVLCAAPLTLAGAGGGSPGLLAVGLGGAALAALAAAAGVVRGGRLAPPARPTRGGGTRFLAALPAAAGCGLLAGAILVERVAAARWALPGPDPTALGMVLAGAALALAAAALGSARLWPVAVPALALGLAAAPHLPEPEGAVAAAAIAVVAGLVAGHRPALVLAALAMAAAFGPAEPAAGLLGAGAVLALVVPRPAAALLGLPGAAALAAVLVAAEPGPAQAALALAGAATAVPIARSAGGRAGPLLHRGLPIRRPGGAGAGRPEQPVPVDGVGRSGNAGPAPEALPALVLAGWLVVAPGSWTWTGRLELHAYNRGAAVAAAAGGLALVTAWVIGAARPVARRPPSAAAPPAAPPRGARLHARRHRAGRRSVPGGRPLRRAAGDR